MTEIATVTLLAWSAPDPVSRGYQVAINAALNAKSTGFYVKW